MGLADRDYIKQGRGPGRGRGGGSPVGDPRSWSFNAWLIAINIAVFVMMVLLGHSVATPVWMDDTLAPQARDVPAGAIGLASNVGDRQGVILVRPLVDTRTTPPEIIGTRTYRYMDPLTAFGHFSTAKAFLWFPGSGITAMGLEVWRLITFQFLHHGIWHLLLNMLGLYFFGRAVEEYLGSKRYLAFYLMCGLCGGLAYLLLNLAGLIGLALPGALNVAPTTPLVGASAGVFGVIVANAFIHPHARVQLLFLPIPIKMTWFAYGYVAVAAINLFIVAGRNQGGDAAHLGGAIAGFFFIRRPHLLREFFDVFTNSSKPKRSGKRDASGRGHRSGPDRRRDEEIDKVLAKIARDGMGSLSDKEKRVLQEASTDRRG